MTDENALEDEAFELNDFFDRVPYIPTEDERLPYGRCGTCVSPLCAWDGSCHICDGDDFIPAWKVMG